MSDAKDYLNDLLADLSCIKIVLRDIENDISKVSDVDFNLSQVFNKTRESVKSLVQTVCKSSKDFNRKYDLLLEKKVIIKSAEEPCDELKNDAGVVTEKSTKSANVNNDTITNSQNNDVETSSGSVERFAEELDENSLGTSNNDLGINAECDNSSGHLAESKNSSDDEISNNSVSNHDESNSSSSSENFKDAGNTTTTNMKSDNTDMLNHSKGKDRESDVNEEIQNESRPLITLVDINKLVDPNRKQNKKFMSGSSDESSVILLSPSSDDDKPLVSKKSIPKKNRTERSSKRLKNSEANKSKTKTENNFNDSDSDLRTKTASRSLRSVKKTKPGSRTTPISLRLRKASLIIISDDSDESDATEEKNKYKKALDSKNDIRKPNLRIPKPARNIFQKATKVISDSESSCSGGEINAAVDKFKSKAVVLLPLIPCERLQQACLENEKLFDVKRLSDVDRLKRKRHADDNLGENSSSSNSDKRVIKRRIGPKSKTQLQDGADLEKETVKHSIDSKYKGKPGPKSKMVLRETRFNKKCTSSEKNQPAADSEKIDLPSLKKVDENHESSKEEVNSDLLSAGEDGKQSSDTEKESEVTKDEPSDQDNQAISISSSDSEEELKTKAKRKVKRKNKHRIDSDSGSVKEEDSDGKEDSDSQDVANSSSYEDKNKESSTDTDTEEERKEAARKKRKRIKLVEESSDEDDKSTRKQIRKVRGVSKSTIVAEAEEKERKARILEKQKKYNHIFNTPSEINAKVEKVVLDLDEKTEKPILKVDDEIVAHLKPHQASGIQFMWDACFESMKRIKKTIGSGCILAHCMGLGKTLQVVALSHTLLVNEETGVKKVMVVAPLNTVLNWVAEYKKWMPDEDDFEIYELVTCKPNERQYEIENWNKTGGVLIIGYQMFRTLTDPNNKRLLRKVKELYRTSLVDPGPDLVICDEGHLLKNEKSHLSIAMNRIKTLRRIVLTGTPLQNNLREYFCMVQFIKPSLLGTYKEYLNRFVNPITNGQYTDSTPHDIALMRRRSHVLHKLLDGVVQRRDYAVLAPYLPPKHEYILDVSLTELQIKLYEHYMTHFARQNQSGKTSYLFVDFEVLRSICTHPRVLLEKHIANDKKECFKSDDEDSEGSLKDFIDDSDNESSSDKRKDNNIADDDDSCESDNNDSSHPRRQRITRAQAAAAKANGITLVEEEVTRVIAHNAWWRQYCTDDDLDNIANSNKMYLMFEILKECEQIGDKVLIFSQSLFSLDLIEYFLAKIDEATQENNTAKTAGFSGSWALGLDYFRLDGSSSCDNRSSWCNTFNDPNNTRARLFLISTRAGGLGINLVAANRVIIFDVSWNPSHDIQSIYRVYRFGQTKPCYVYRFVTYGTMEMKIYERQVTKQAISKRVIDEQQIDRHYNQNDLAELYKFEPKMTNRPIPLVPKDVLLGELLHTHEDKLVTYHEHQSLLENKEDEELNEEERKAAWDEFENEKVARTFNSFNSMGVKMSPHMVTQALNNLIKKDNPNWTSEQIKSILPAMVKELEHQVAKGDLTMYKRIEQEIKLIQLEIFKRNKERMMQQQGLIMLQRQQQQQQLYNNSIQGMNIQNIEQLRLLNQLNQWKAAGMRNMPGPSGLPRGFPSGLNITTLPSNPNEIIDLND